MIKKAPQTNEKAATKWGDAARAGFQLLPDLLLTKQAQLGLAPTDILVLANLTMHWWYEDQKPFPRSSTIAKRMGVDARTVQRSIRKMAGLGLLKQVAEERDGQTRQVVDFSGLVAQLCKLAQSDTNFIARTQKWSGS